MLEIMVLMTLHKKLPIMELNIQLIKRVIKLLIKLQIMVHIRAAIIPVNMGLNILDKIAIIILHSNIQTNRRKRSLEYDRLFA